MAQIVAGRPVHLQHCRIKGTLDLYTALTRADAAQDNSASRKVVLTQDLNFNSCIFEEDVSFSGPWENTEGLCVTFEGDVLFNMSLFCGQSRFIAASFNNAGRIKYP